MVKQGNWWKGIENYVQAFTYQGEQWDNLSKVQRRYGNKSHMNLLGGEILCNTTPQLTTNIFSITLLQQNPLFKAKNKE